MLFGGIGPEGQERLLASRAAIVGCGAIALPPPICSFAPASATSESSIAISSSLELAASDPLR